MMLIDIDGATIDLERGDIRESHGAIRQRLSTREVDLLRYLYERRGQDVSREELLREVWGFAPSVLSRALDTTVARLRRKLEEDSRAPRHLLTVHGHGYRWAAPSPPPPDASRPPVAAAQRVLELPDRRVDLGRLVVVAEDGREEPLTAAEGHLLEVLSRASGEWVAPDDLVPGTRSREAAMRRLKNAVYRLRKKLESDPGDPRVLVSSRTCGYRLDHGALAARFPNTPSFLWEIARHVGGCLGLEDCVLYLRRDDTLEQVAAHGPKSPASGLVLDPIQLRVGEGIVGSAAATGRVERVPDTRVDPRYIFDCYAGRSELSVPILDRGRVVGVIDSESDEADAYDDRVLRAMQSLADVVASGLRDVGWNS